MSELTKIEAGPAEERTKEPRAALHGSGGGGCSGDEAGVRVVEYWLDQLVSLINGEISHYMSQGSDSFSVSCGPWHITYDAEQEAKDRDRVNSGETATDRNRAKIRRALEDSDRVLADVVYDFDPENIGYVAMRQMSRNDDALKAPPRNCDRFDSEVEARIAFLREEWLIYVSDLSAYPFDGWTEEMKSRYCKWLLAANTVIRKKLEA